jgi:hypothetical protein
MGRAIWLTVIAAVAVATAPSAIAGDMKVMPGSACLAKHGSEQGDLDYTNGRVMVPSGTTGSRVVVCPMLRDDTLNAWIDADIMLATTTSYGPYCTVYCCDTTGASCDSQNVSTTADGTNQLKDFSVASVDANGSCVFECTLQPGTVVRWYRWEE